LTDAPTVVRCGEKQAISGVSAVWPRNGSGMIALGSGPINRIPARPAM
jgi:hypothetical protein